ncbi:ComF family protein [Pseudoflavitalea sp. G-6-1-2]|uniref:ComF family protein n=1 Tax=Pseudoflavitalea sp. G-6-1-2 TaxID=2728841 RepID=UPI00146D4AFB|nr:ComF family protein [Pseudoflavitalea sp. G-6-1-2]NML20331.1 ComF family protein [Pseudoflavitalea sp. G-6-1-2]
MQIQEAAQSLLHLFFPQTCAGCGSDAIDKEQLICLSCLQRLPVTDFLSHNENTTEKLLMGRFRFLHAASYLFYTHGSVIQRLIHQFKYKQRKDIGLFFGKKMGGAIQQSSRFKQIDALVPLPLHPRKEKQRHYNQAAILCEGISSELHLPILNKAVTRISASSSQTSRNRLARWQNIDGSFVLQDPDQLAGRHILLVDDVITTGATLEACSRELLKAPIASLSICTLACAMK